MHAFSRACAVLADGPGVDCRGGGLVPGRPRGRTAHRHHLTSGVHRSVRRPGVDRRYTRDRRARSAGEGEFERGPAAHPARCGGGAERAVDAGAVARWRHAGRKLAGTADTPNRIAVARPIGKKAQPGLATGPAKITITAERPVFFGCEPSAVRSRTMCSAARAGAGRGAVAARLDQPRRRGVRRLRPRRPTWTPACGSATRNIRPTRPRRSASPMRQCAWRSSRCVTIRTSTRDLGLCARHRRQPRPRRRSSMGRFRKPSCGRGLPSTSASSMASVPAIAAEDARPEGRHRVHPKDCCRNPSPSTAISAGERGHRFPWPGGADQDRNAVA